MKRLAASLLLASIAVPAAAASEPAAYETLSPDGGASVTSSDLNSRIVRLVIVGLQPDRPVGGQMAQLTVLAIASADQTFRSRPDFRRRILIQIDGHEVDVNPANISDLSANDGVERNYAFTFTWPAIDYNSRSLISSTRTQIITIRDLVDPKLSFQKIVTVDVPGVGIFVIIFIVGFLLCVIISLIIYRIIRRHEVKSASANPIISSTSDGAVVADFDDPPVNFAPLGSAQTVGPPAPPPDPPAELLRAVAANEAVLVLGPGLSSLAGLPTGIELVRLLARELSQYLPSSLAPLVMAASDRSEFAELVVQLGGPVRALQMVTTAAPENLLYETMMRLMQQPAADLSVHGLLARPAWRAVIDLNYDDLARRVFVDEPGGSGAMRSVTVLDSVELISSSRSGERLLFEPFGDFGRPSTVAFGMENLRRLLARAPEYQRALAGLFQSQSCLFVGVDTDTIDQFIQAITLENPEATTSHFALIPRGPYNDLRAAALERFGVTLLNFEPTSATNALKHFAQELHKRARPAYSSLAAANSSSGLSDQRIRHLKLENIGPFESLDLDFARHNDESWSVIFGSNGVGKSSILRAIALALAGAYTPAADAGQRLLRTGASEGLIELQIGRHTYRTRLRLDRTRVHIVPSQTTPLMTGAVLVLGFPALRGARTPEPPGPSQKPEALDPDPADVVALISGEVDGRLADFKQWVVNTLILAEKGEPQAGRKRDLLNQVIRELIPGNADQLAGLAGDFVIRFETPDGPVRFDDLSQGMASIFNWVGLLIQRLFSICETSPNPAHEPAIVLIDEIDAHLHPDWQRKLVEIAKTHFPNLQVIATSHSALIAGALRATELIVLSRGTIDGKVAVVDQVPELYGLDAQDILTSAAFGLPSDRNPEVQRKLELYFERLNKVGKSAAERTELREMADELNRYRIGLHPDPVALPTVEEIKNASQAQASALADAIERITNAAPGAVRTYRAEAAMIYVRKDRPAEPAWIALNKRGEDKRDEHLKKFAQDEDFEISELYKEHMRYLLECFANKCAYCESDIASNQPGDVEHYRPKGRVVDEKFRPVRGRHSVKGEIDHPGYFWLAYDWDNLLPSCIDCNRYRKHGSVDPVGAGKADRFPVAKAHIVEPGDLAQEEALLINPTLTDPAQHLLFNEDGTVEPMTPAGAATISLLGLNNRIGLVKARRRAIDHAKRFTEAYFSAIFSGHQERAAEDAETVTSIDEGKVPFAAMERLGMEIVAKRGRYSNLLLRMAQGEQ